MIVEAGCPIALSSDAHVPEHIGYGYDQALELLADVGVTELCVFEGRERRLEPIGVIRTGIGVDSHRFEPGRPLILGGVDIPHEEGLAGHSDADVLTHAIIDALLGAAAHGRHRPALPRHRRALAGRRLARPAARGRATAWPRTASASSTSTRR